MKVSSKIAREISAIVDEVRNILYNNITANCVELHISWERGGLPLFTYEVKDKAVIVDETVN
jgi:hypothetical protein